MASPSVTPGRLEANGARLLAAEPVKRVGLTKRPSGPAWFDALGPSTLPGFAEPSAFVTLDLPTAAGKVYALDCGASGFAHKPVTVRATTSGGANTQGTAEQALVLADGHALDAFKGFAGRTFVTLRFSAPPEASPVTFWGCKFFATS